MKRKLYYFSVLLLVLFPLHSQAWITHSSLIGKQETVRYQSSNPLVVLRQTRSHNQGLSDECYVFAFMGALDVANRNGWNRPFAPDLSSEYMFLDKLRAWSRESLTKGLPLDQGFFFLRGGDVHHAMKLSVEEGLYPHALFNPRRPYTDWDFEKIYHQVREEVKAGRARLRGLKNPAQQHYVVNQTLANIEKQLVQYAGIWPQRFIWRGAQWTPKTFEHQFGIQRNSSIYMMYPPGRWDMGDPWDLRRALKDLVQVFQGAFNYRQSSWPKIWAYITQSIDSGLPTILSLKWGSTYHVMTAVGYEYNNQNQIVSVRLKNSWGHEYGDFGHAHFDPRDLQKNLTTVWGFRKPE